jgi:hypothetical protein
MSDTVKIELWSTTVRGSAWITPELRETILQGYIYGHPKHDEGRRVHTSPIVKAEGRIVTTRSGTVYELGEPDPRWLRWLKANNLEYNEDNPIKVRK